MEKKKTSRKLKVFIIFIYITLIFTLLVIEIVSVLLGFAFSVSWIIYWFLIVGWIFTVWNYKLKSSKSLLLALTLFSIASVCTAVGLYKIGETIMRISFIGWVVGITQALIEYKKIDEKGNTS